MACINSTPQAVLQLVYLMRTGDFRQPIFAISIVQSILSMTNSMLASDNAYMAREKFKRHKRRLPPTIEFLKHFLIRFSEISSRIGLFAIFWTVAGGAWFCGLMIYELIYPVFVTSRMLMFKVFEWEEFFLLLNMVCVYLYILCTETFFLIITVCLLYIFLYR